MTQARVWKGQKKEVALGLNEDLFVTMPTGSFKHLQTSIELPDPLRAPIKKGSHYGKVSIMLNNQILASKPLLALADNNKGGCWRNLADSVQYGFYRIFSKSNEKANNG